MKRVQAWLLIFLLTPLLASAGVEEGRNYQKLPFTVAVETGNKIEVREIFWYGCPHCYVLEPGITRWLKKMPKNAQFVRTPGTVSPNWLLHAQTYYTFEALDALPKLHEVFFKGVQEQRQQLSTEDGIAKFVAAHGVDAKKFHEAFNSFGVRMKLEKAKQLNQDLNINSVPTVVVDGKYLTSPAMAEGEENFFQVLDFLINKAAKERKKKTAP